LNPAGLRARSLGLDESAKPRRCQQHLGGRLKFSLNTSNGAVFFCGVSSPGSTSASAPCSSLFQVDPLTIPTLAAVLCFIRLVRFGYLSVLFFVALFGANCFIGFISLLPKRLASPVSSQRHNKSLNTGLAISSRSLFNTG